MDNQAGTCAELQHSLGIEVQVCSLLRTVNPEAAVHQVSGRETSHSVDEIMPCLDWRMNM